MSFWRRWWPRAGASLATSDRPGPAPTILQPTDRTNPIESLLDASRLPWREPRREVESRIGITTDPIYRRKVVFFADAAQPPGFLQPWHADVFERYAPDMPVVRFSSLEWFADDAAVNIQQAADVFEARLGPAEVGRQYNTLTCRWQSGTASLELTSWPPAWQSRGLTNEAYARDPRAATACHLTLLTGFRLPLSAKEQRWVADFRPVAATRSVMRSMPGGLLNTAPTDTEVEYARDPGNHLDAVQDRVGTPAGREALILCTHQLFVVPARDVIGFEVTRMRPAKGGGGSTLQMRCRTTCPGVAYKTLHVAQHVDPDGIVPLGQELAAMFGTACEVGPYFDDV